MTGGLALRGRLSSSRRMSVVAERVRGGRPGRLRESLTGYAFVILPMAVFGIFFLFPMGYAVYISFFDWGLNGADHSVGFDNYSTALHDPLFWRSMRNIAEFTVWVVPAQMALGLFMAVIVNQKIRARPFFRSAFYFPSIASSAAITTIAIFILNADGLLNHVLGFFGIDHQDAWFAVPKTAMPSIAGLNAWTTSGTMMLFYLAALQAIPNDVYEAAAIDGAGRWRTFWKVTFPLLKPGHFFVLVISIIGALKLYDQAFIVSGGTGGPDYSTMTPVLFLVQKLVNNIQFGYSAAIGVLLFILIFSLTVFQRLLFGREDT
jgi:multiple sugar transport system permease protein